MTKKMNHLSQSSNKCIPTHHRNQQTAKRLRLKTLPITKRDDMNHQPWNHKNNEDYPHWDIWEQATVKPTLSHGTD